MVGMSKRTRSKCVSKNRSFSYCRILSALSAQITEDWGGTVDHSQVERYLETRPWHGEATEAVVNKLRTPKGHFTGSNIEVIPEPEVHRAQTRPTLNLLVL